MYIQTRWFYNHPIRGLYTLIYLSIQFYSFIIEESDKEESVETDVQANG